MNGPSVERRRAPYNGGAPPPRSPAGLRGYQCTPQAVPAAHRLQPGAGQAIEARGAAELLCG